MAKKINFGGLSKQYNDSVATKDAFSSAGSTASRIFNTKVFGDTPFLKMEKDKTYRIRFVPYIVDKDHPKVQQGRLDEGDAAYVFDYTHHVIGPNNTRVLCPNGTYGKPCPICDRQRLLRKEDANPDEIKALKASRRVLYNVILTDDPSKLYILAESHFLFEKELLAELKKGDDEGEEYSIADFCVGASEGRGLALKVMVEEDKLNGQSFNRYSFKVVKNNADVDESVLDKAIPLHKAVKELPVSELESLLYGITSEDDDDDDDEDDVPTKKLVIGKKPAKVEDDDDEDDVPKRKSTVYDDEDDAEEGEDLSDDDVPAYKAPECPHGYDFGVDVNREDECDNCPLYEECYAEKKRRKAEKRG